MAITADILRSTFGFNDPNVISGILSDPSQVARYEKEYAGTTGEGGNGGIDVSGIPGMEEYTKGQFATEDPILQALLTRMGGQEKPLDIYGRLETEAGLPEMRGAAKTLTGEIANLEDILYGIEPQVEAVTKESLVTEAQRKGIVQARAKPFLEAFSRVSTALGRIAGRITKAEAGIATKVQLAMEGMKMELRPLELYYSVLVDRNARLASAFSTDRELKLDILFDKVKRGRTLSDAEQILANDLASEEREYLRSLQETAAGLGIVLTGGEDAATILGMIGRKRGEESWSGLTEGDISEGNKEW